MGGMDIELIALFGMLFSVSVPLWFPIVAAAYAVGRKRFSLRFLFVVITAEAILLGGAGFVFWLYGTWVWSNFRPD